MLRVTTEVDGKKYELVPDKYICSGCDLNINKACIVVGEKRSLGFFNGQSVCGKLGGIWKEIKDES